MNNNRYIVIKNDRYEKTVDNLDEYQEYLNKMDTSLIDYLFTSNDYAVTYDEPNDRYVISINNLEEKYIVINGLSVYSVEARISDSTMNIIF